MLCSIEADRSPAAGEMVQMMNQIEVGESPAAVEGADDVVNWD